MHMVVTVGGGGRTETATAAVEAAEKGLTDAVYGLSME